MQQIECVENDAVGLPPYGGLKRLKVRRTVTILHNGFAINDCRFAAENRSCLDDRRIAFSPIVAIAAEDANCFPLDHHLRAVAIVLDFVNPVLALRGLINGRSKLWLDEPQDRETRHWANYRRSPLASGDFFHLIRGENGDGGTKAITSASISIGG